jgi:hypothetical protein
VHAEQMKKIQKTAIYQVIVREHGEEAFHNMDPQAVFAEEVLTIASMMSMHCDNRTCRCNA